MKNFNTPRPAIYQGKNPLLEAADELQKKKMAFAGTCAKFGLAATKVWKMNFELMARLPGQRKTGQCLPGGCSALNKVDTPRGEIYDATVGINVYQGLNDNGIFLGEV